MLEANEPLVEAWLPNQLGTRESADARGERVRIATAALDQIGNASAAELA